MKGTCFRILLQIYERGCQISLLLQLDMMYTSGVNLDAEIGDRTDFEYEHGPTPLGFIRG